MAEKTSLLSKVRRGIHKVLAPGSPFPTLPEGEGTSTVRRGIQKVLAPGSPFPTLPEGERPELLAEDTGRGLVENFKTPTEPFVRQEGGGPIALDAKLTPNEKAMLANELKNMGRFARHIAVKGVESFLYPAVATADLLTIFGNDIVQGLTGKKVGKTASERVQKLQERYGPLTGGAAAVAQGVGEGVAVGAFGAQVGAIWEALGKKAPGLYVLEVQKLHLEDLNTDLNTLVEDHTFYHQQLGKAAETPHMSVYHDSLTDRLATELDLPAPVLQEDYARVWREAMRNTDPEASANFPSFSGEEAIRVVKDAPPIAQRTPAESTAIYRYENARTYTVTDQWTDFKEGVIRDLRRVNVPEETLDSVRTLPRNGATIADFADEVSNNVAFDDDVVPILRSWNQEVSVARDIYKQLRADGTWKGSTSSSVLEMEKAFADTGSQLPQSNALVASKLRETANLYSKRGDVNRFTAYNRAADLVTTKGAPDLADLAIEGSQAIQEAFEGQGGIGKQISSHIEDIVETGTFPEYEALQQSVPLGEESSLVDFNGKQMTPKAAEFLEGWVEKTRQQIADEGKLRDVVSSSHKVDGEVVKTFSVKIAANDGSELSVGIQPNATIFKNAGIAGELSKLVQDVKWFKKLLK